MMTSSEPSVPVFDGHNDAVLRLWLRRSDPVAEFLKGGGGGHLDLPKARTGGFAGGLFAMFVPSARDDARMERMRQAGGYDVPLPAPLTASEAMPAVLAMASILFRIERASEGAFRICRSAAEIEAARGAGAVAAVLHIEGAEAIDRDFDALHVLYEAGLRSIGPVWSRPNLFGHGVPFRFPSGPDTGDGLTEAGRALVSHCNRMGILIDLSHITEAGFWDVARLSTAPLVASHSNAHTLCPHARNLTDRQLHAIRDTGGIVGLNFATCFLRTDGRMDHNTPVDLMVRQIEYMLEQVGPQGVGLGSDFDGATIPADIGDAAGLPVLIQALRANGHDEQAIARLCWDNWLSVLARTFGG